VKEGYVGMLKNDDLVKSRHPGENRGGICKYRWVKKHWNPVFTGVTRRYDVVCVSDVYGTGYSWHGKNYKPVKALACQ